MWTIREIERVDFDALYRLDQECFEPGIAYTRSDLRLFLAQPRSISLLAESAPGELLGFVIAELQRKKDSFTGHIVTIDVADAARRLGVGRALMRAAEQRLRDMGAGVVRLEVAVDNVGAQRFYEREQYKLTGRIRGYYLGRLDAFVFAKELGEG